MSTLRALIAHVIRDVRIVFLIFDSRNQKFRFFIIIYQPTQETGSDKHQARMISPAVHRQRADVSLVVPSAPRPRDSLAVSAAADVHFSNSHCLAHTSFGAPNSRPGYSGSTIVATTTTYRRSSVTVRQSRHQRSSRRQHATWWSN